MKPGDLVIYTVRSGSFSTIESWAKVTNVTPKGTVTAVALDGARASKEFRPSRYIQPGGERRYHGLRLATAYELANREWWLAKPKTALVWIGSGLGSRIGDGVSGMSIRVDLDIKTEHTVLDRIARARQAAAELEAVAVWMSAQPDRSTFDREMLATAHQDLDEEDDDADE